MLDATKIMLIDDDDIDLLNLKKRLNSVLVGSIITTASSTEAINLLQNSTPDLILLNHYLKKGLTSVQFAYEYIAHKNIPFIIISDFHNEMVLKEILPIKPIDFISKSCSEFELKKAVELALLFSFNQKRNATLEEFFFVKVGQHIRKVNTESVEMIEVEGKYLNIYTKDHNFVVKSSLNDFIKRLPSNFIKVHQSYVINLNFIESIQLDDLRIKLEHCEAKFSRNFKKILLQNNYFT